MRILAILFVLATTLAGCAGMDSINQADRNAQAVFTFDYQVTNASKADLWTRARDYFAQAFGDSRAVLRVQDKEAGTLLGRASVSWPMMTTLCSSEYSLKFQSKEGKARLQLELLEGAPAFSACPGWHWPSVSGYEKIKTDFSLISAALEKRLKESDSFSDF